MENITEVLAVLKTASQKAREKDGFVSVTPDVMDAIAEHIESQAAALKLCGEALAELVKMIKLLRFKTQGKPEVDYPGLTDAEIALALPAVREAIEGK